MPMPPYPVSCYTRGCGREAVYKIAARWSGGVPRVRLGPAALVGRNHDDWRGVGLALEVFEDRVPTHGRHHHVEDGQIGPLLVDGLFTLVAVAGRDGAVSLALQHGPRGVHE